MDLALVGLGKMGLNMSMRLLRGGHRVVVRNRSPEPAETARGEGAEVAESLDAVVAALAAPRVVWLMLPSGEVTDAHVDAFIERLEPGDVLVEGGNSRWTDSVARGERAAAVGIRYVDVGVSGGIWGLAEGYATMAGGDLEAVRRLEPALKTLAPSPTAGWGRVGPTGAGHFVKMVHNGIEYGVMQAFAEGFAILDAKCDWGTRDGTPVEASLDLGQVADVWREGSVVRSWLLDLAAEALQARPGLGGIAPVVPDSGEGRWTVEAAVDLGVPATVLAASLFERYSSRSDGFARRLVSAMRGEFGGHPVQGDPGADGAFADQILEDGTIEVVPGGVRTEGASSR